MKDALRETLIIDSGGFEECIFVLMDFGMGIFCSIHRYCCTIHALIWFESSRNDENALWGHCVHGGQVLCSRLLCLFSTELAYSPFYHLMAFFFAQKCDGLCMITGTSWKFCFTYCLGYFLFTFFISCVIL